MNRYPFVKVIIINCLLEQDGLTGYDIIKYCRGNGIPASSGTVYPHLKAMEETGIIACREEGRRKVYYLTEAGRSEMESTALGKAPEFLKNTYFKSIWLAATLDWTKKDEVKVLVDNVDEIKRYLMDYMDKLL
jgi:DNA-binding PadR family transcriptional regulator